MKLFDWKNKHILIQDVGDMVELQRFIGHNIYRRDPPPADGIDFFAPYFTLAAQETIGLNGICCYSSVLFILEAITVDNAVKIFAADREKLQKVFGNLTVFKWESGINLLNNERDKKYTYYFLDEPITLKNPIVKETPAAAPLKLNRELPRNLTKSMQELYEAAQQTQ